MSSNARGQSADHYNGWLAVQEYAMADLRADMAEQIGGSSYHPQPQREREPYQPPPRAYLNVRVTVVNTKHHHSVRLDHPNGDIAWVERYAIKNVEHLREGEVQDVGVREDRFFMLGWGNPWRT